MAIIMLLRVFSCALVFSPQLLAASLDDVPIEVFQSSIASLLQPGAIARLGLASRTSHYLSEGGLSRYKKGGAYDLDMLFRAYHTVDEYYERDCIRRLIEATLPDVNDKGYVIQNKYQLCKKELFSGDYINYSCISDAYPELSLMLLKHKRFIYDRKMDFKACCSPLLIDAFVGSLGKISINSLWEMFKYADPRKLGPAFSIIDNPQTPGLQNVLETGDLSSLLDTDHRALSMLYLFTQASEDTMELVLEYLSRFGQTPDFLVFVPNFMKYEHLSPVAKSIIEHYIYAPIISFRPEFLNSIDSGHFKDYYSVFKGPSYVDDSLKYLESFKDGDFQMAPPTDALCRDLLETAIVHGFSESLLLALLEKFVLYPNLPLVILALKHGVPSNILIEIINSNRMADWDVEFEEIAPIEQPIDLEVFRELMANPNPSSISFLLHINMFSPNLDIVNILLEDPKLNEANLGHLASQVFRLERGAPIEMVLRIIEACFEQGLNVSWDFQADPSVAVQFLEAQSTEALLEYVKEYKNNPFRNMHGVAMAIICTRPDGYPAFHEKYLTGPGNSKSVFYGTLVLLKARHENLNHSKVISLISSHWKYFFENDQFIEMDENEDLELVYQSMSAWPNAFGLKKFIENYVIHCIERRRPMSSIMPIKYITYESSRAIFNHFFMFRLNFLDTDMDYYKPRLESETLYMDQKGKAFPA